MYKGSRYTLFQKYVFLKVIILSYNYAEPAHQRGQSCGDMVCHSYPNELVQRFL